LALVAIGAAAQTPVVQITNTSRPGQTDYVIGERFQVVITGSPNQPVSVRTSRGSKTDWGPVIDITDASGRWSTLGQFEKSDFGVGVKTGRSEANWLALRFAFQSRLRV
jgi:hypothetical protein